MKRTAGVVAALVCFLLVPLLAQRGSGQGGQRGSAPPAPAAQGAKPPVTSRPRSQTVTSRTTAAAPYASSQVGASSAAAPPAWASIAGS